jgi:hypothetical protein
MPTTVIRIELPRAGDAAAPGDDQTQANKKARQEFLDTVGPSLASLLDAPARRAGNVNRVEILAENMTDDNHFLVLLTVDAGKAGVEWASSLPPGASVSELGTFRSLQHWPEHAPDPLS